MEMIQGQVGKKRGVEEITSADNEDQFQQTLKRANTTTTHATNASAAKDPSNDAYHLQYLHQLASMAQFVPADGNFHHGAPRLITLLGSQPGNRTEHESPMKPAKTRRERKNEREKQRRLEVNTMFDRLMDLLEIPKDNKSDKVKVLAAAVDTIETLRRELAHHEVSKLQLVNGFTNNNSSGITLQQLLLPGLGGFSGSGTTMYYPQLTLPLLPQEGSSRAETNTDISNNITSS